VWAVPFRQLRCRSTDTLCTLIYRLHHASAVFPPGGGLWHTVVFLRMALHHATRTLFSFQGTETSVPVLSSLSLNSLTMSIQ
jgi:hypothetical protein